MSDAAQDEGALSFAALRALRDGTRGVAVSAAEWSAVDAAAASVARIVARGEPVYGVNTGFGLLAQTRISDDKLAALQRNLVLSHCCGMGEDLPDAVVRLTLALKIRALARGASGVRRVVIERLLALIDGQAYPCLPAQGSVGASGDLAPLAHLAAALLGEGRIRVDGAVLPAADALKRSGLDPLELEAKEGLALLNGTQVSTALALDALFEAEDAFRAALVAGAMSLDAMMGSDAPFDPRIHALRGQPGQAETAEAYRRLLAGSEIRASHVDCDKVQDPYSLRCQPQVMGACLDVFRAAAGMLKREAAAVTDNPLIFAEEDAALSGGNFHAEPVAFAADMIAMAATEMASLSERRIAALVDPNMSGLPAFLVEEPGLNSGFMIAQVTAAALVSENKTLSHPASADSLPTSANQEDHVSMATWAARKAGMAAVNAARVIAIECLAACQGLDARAPLATSDALAAVQARIREKVPHYDADRYFADDLATAEGLVRSGAIGEAVGVWFDADA